MKGILLRTNGSVEVIEYEDTLEQLQKIVGGYIEYVNAYEHIKIIVNEEGWLLGLDENRNASILYLDRMKRRKYLPTIVGDALVVSTIEGENVSLNDEQISFVMKRLKKLK